MNSVFSGCLLGLLLVQLLVCLLAWRYLAKRMRDIAEAWKHAGAGASASDLTNAVARIEARLEQIGATRTPPPAARPQAGDRAYELAQRMARNGTDAAQIAEACGISVHEAELLCRLHAPTR